MISTNNISSSKAGGEIVRNRHGSKRIYLVRRVEYLLDFLEVVKSGYSREAAEARLADRKRRFEIEKARALGRGNPFTSKLKEAPGLARFAEEIARGTHLVEREPDGIYQLTSDGRRLLKVVASNDDPSAFLLNSLFASYPSFFDVISAIDNTNEKEVILPMSVKEDFSASASKYALSVDIWTFHIIRDLCSQLGILNWFRYIQAAESMQKVYLTCTIKNCDPQEMLSSWSFPLKVLSRERLLIIAPNVPVFEVFRETLWNEYLEMTKYVPRKPVFYSSLRDRVCYALRIPDKRFDAFATSIMDKDDKYLLVAGGGSLPYSRDSAGMLKSLPPQTSRGQYMIYLKMDQRST